MADSLYKKMEEEFSQEPSLVMISSPVPDWVNELNISYKDSDEAQHLISKLTNNLDPPKYYRLQQGLILKKGRIFNCAKTNIQIQVLYFIHEDPVAGHLGYLKTYQRANKIFLLE